MPDDSQFPSGCFGVFLATGGDAFTVFKEGTNDLGGAVDIDALVDYFKAAEPTGIAVPALNRIVPKP